MNSSHDFFYFYLPLPAYPHVLKCQGIADDTNVDWFVQLHPEVTITDGYKGDRIRAKDHARIA